MTISMDFRKILVRADCWIPITVIHHLMFVWDFHPRSLICHQVKQSQEWKLGVLASTTAPWQVELVLSSTCVAVCHLSSLSSHQFVGICETRGTGKEEKQEYSIDIRRQEIFEGIERKRDNGDNPLMWDRNQKRFNRYTRGKRYKKGRQERSDWL